VRAHKHRELHFTRREFLDNKSRKGASLSMPCNALTGRLMLAVIVQMMLTKLCNFGSLDFVDLHLHQPFFLQLSC